MPKKEIVLNKMFGKLLVPVAPPFPFVDLAGVKTVADFRAAVGVVTDKIKEKRVKEPSVPSVPSAPSPKRKGGKK